MNEDQREAIALKKFSVISPVLNGQVKNNLEYFKEAAQTPIEMPYLGVRKYSVKTLQWWLCEYRRYGFSGLVKDQRSDKGKRRKISVDLGRKIAGELRNVCRRSTWSLPPKSPYKTFSGSFPAYLILPSFIYQISDISRHESICTECVAIHI